MTNRFLCGLLIVPITRRACRSTQEEFSDFTGRQVIAISIDDTGARSRVNTGYYRIESPLGVEDMYAALETVFPNPCTDQIKLSLTETRDTNIKIFDALGRIVHESVVTGKEATIETHGFNPGLYYIVANSSGKSSYRTFVKV